MGNKTKAGDRRGQGVRLGDGTVVGRVSSCFNPDGVVDKDVYNRLTTLKAKYKSKLVTELKENRFCGIKLVIDKAMDELFDELAQR